MVASQFPVLAFSSLSLLEQMPNPSDYENVACTEEGLDLGYISAQTHQNNIKLQSSLQILLNGDLSLLCYYLQLEVLFSEQGQLAVRVGGFKA